MTFFNASTYPSKVFRVRSLILYNFSKNKRDKLSLITGAE